MIGRQQLLELLWAVGVARFSRWADTYGKTSSEGSAGGAAAVAQLAFVSQLRELDDEELAVAFRRLPTHAFEGQRNGWFLPTPADLIDMVRDVPPQALAIQQYKRLAPEFLDSPFGARMRVALLTGHDAQTTPRAAHAGALRVCDDFELQRAYQLALHWTRDRAKLELDRVAVAQLHALPSAHELLAEMSAHDTSTEAPAVRERMPITDAGLRCMEHAAERLGIDIEQPAGQRTSPGM